MEEEKTELSKNANGETKVKIAKRDGEVIRSVPRWLGAMGPCQGRAETLWGPWGAEHHPPESRACPETRLLGAHTTSQLTSESSQLGGKRNKSLFGVCLFSLAEGEGGAAPLKSRGLAPSTCSDSEKEVTGTCRQEPLTYIKKVYSRESVYISINILCIYINKYIKRKECIILMQHKAVLRERVSQNKSIAI